MSYNLAHGFARQAQSPIHTTSWPQIHSEDARLGEIQTPKPMDLQTHPCLVLRAALPFVREERVVETLMAHVFSPSSVAGWGRQTTSSRPAWGTQAWFSKK